MIFQSIIIFRKVKGKIIMKLSENEMSGVQGFNLEELAQLYNTTQDELYFNQLWYGVKAFSISISKKYVTIPYEDKISIAMEVLFRCLPKLNSGKGKVLTYYGNALRCEYISYIEKQKTKKAELNDSAYSLEQLKEDVNYEPSKEIDFFSVDDFISEHDLDILESAVVRLLNDGYKTMEISKSLKLSLQDYKQLLTNIQNKILNKRSEGLTL